MAILGPFTASLFDYYASAQPGPNFSTSDFSTSDFSTSDFSSSDYSALGY
jgi:hypothetical protein